jgi:hypothetical protein
LTNPHPQNIPKTTQGAAAQSYITTTPQAQALAPMAAAPAARGPCDMGLTFFPPRGDNLPTGWSQAVQQANGNTANDQMLRIALAGYPIPQLYMAPVSVYTQVGGSVPVQCVTGQPSNAAGVLTRPAAFTITWALAGQSGQIGPFLKGSKQDPPANVTLNFVPQLPDVRFFLFRRGGGCAVAVWRGFCFALLRVLYKLLNFFPTNQPTHNTTTTTIIKQHRATTACRCAWTSCPAPASSPSARSSSRSPRARSRSCARRASTSSRRARRPTSRSTRATRASPST